MWLVGRAIAAAKKAMEWRCKTTTSRAGEGAVQPRTQAIDDGRFSCSIRPEKNNVETIGLPNAPGTIDQVSANERVVEVYLGR